jgi:hypothetical protein
MTDSRGRYLRLGPATYLTDDQLARTAERVAVVALGGAPRNGKRKRLRGVQFTSRRVGLAALRLASDPRRL